MVFFFWGGKGGGVGFLGEWHSVMKLSKVGLSFKSNYLVFISPSLGDNPLVVVVEL